MRVFGLMHDAGTLEAEPGKTAQMVERVAAAKRGRLLDASRAALRQQGGGTECHHIKQAVVALISVTVADSNLVGTACARCSPHACMYARGALTHMQRTSHSC